MSVERASQQVQDDRSRLGFEAFAADAGPRLLRVTCARYGLDIGAEVAADALAWAWEHWEQVQVMANPAGYLYRVAQSSARRHRRWRRPTGLPAEVRDGGSLVEPGLEAALSRLSPNQRTAVLLVHGLDWTYQETATAMGITLAAVRNHVHRGLRRLRTALGEAP